MGHDSHWSPRLGMSQRPPHPIFIAALYTELRCDKNRSVNYPVTVSEADSENFSYIRDEGGIPLVEQTRFERATSASQTRRSAS